MSKQNVKQGAVRKLVAGAGAAALMLVSSTAMAADWPRMSVGASVGSLGAGANFAVELYDVLEARVGINAFATDFDLEVDDLSYNGDVELNSTSAILDVYPIRHSGFRISFGAIINGNEVEGTARPATATEFGGTVFQPEEIGSASANITFPSTAPYLGLGWGRRTGRQGNLMFSLDAGVLFQGRATVDLNVENPLGVISDADIAQARSEIEAELADFEAYPVVTLGFSYSF